MLTSPILAFTVSNLLINGCKLGLIFCIMTLGVHISFRILDAADLGIEGVFPLGGCICAVLIYYNVPSIVATLAAILVGLLGGLLTGVLHTKLKIPMILSGIVTMTALYSTNLAILGITSPESLTRATLAIRSNKSIFFPIANFLNTNFSLGRFAPVISTTIVSIIWLVVIYIVIYYFFGTELGMAIRATGDNEKMAKAQGINTNRMKIIGLMISNALIALAGALFAQNSGAANVSSGRGMIVIGLASIIIGEVIFGRKAYSTQLISLVVGTILYFVLRQVAIELNLAEFLDIASAILIVIILSLPLIKKKLIHSKPKGGEINASN